MLVANYYKHTSYNDHCRLVLFVTYIRLSKNNKDRPCPPLIGRLREGLAGLRMSEQIRFTPHLINSSEACVHSEDDWRHSIRSRLELSTGGPETRLPKLYPSSAQILLQKWVRHYVYLFSVKTCLGYYI